MINEVAGNIGIVTGTQLFMNVWLKDHPETEIIDIKYSATYEEDFICIIYRK